MAKKNVVEIVCDRCDRTEYIPPEEVRSDPALSVTLGFDKQVVQDPLAPGLVDQTHVEFNDLCSSCKKTVKNLFEQMTKKISWKRNKGELEVEVDGETSS